MALMLFTSIYYSLVCFSVSSIIFLEMLISVWVIHILRLLCVCVSLSVQPLGRMWPRMAVIRAQHKVVDLLKTFFAHQFSLVFVYLMCGPRQRCFFQCSLEMPKGWTPLVERLSGFSVGNGLSSLISSYTARFLSPRTPSVF